VFSLYSHPLGKLVIDFTGEFLRHKDRILSARPSTALVKITQEIQTFLGTNCNLTQFLLFL
jgi:hypothetical protein